MSQTSKRPGARDISDLKARLGLKKSGGTPAVPGPPGAAAPSGGIAAPPGAQLPSSIPAPPGVAPPVVPAPAGIAQPAVAPPPQDYVIVNDGKPVESVASSKKGAVIGKTVAMILAPLVAGVLIGKLSAGAGQYNKVIDDSKPILKDVKVVRRGLTELSAILESGKKGEKFVVGDKELLKSLKALPKIEGNDELVFKSSLYHLDWKTSSTIYGFYADIHALQTEVNAHLRASRLESKIMDESKARVGGFNPMGFGAVVDMPNEDDAAAGRPVTVKLVQLGLAVCAGETKPNPAGCGGKAMAGIQHRDDQLGGWKTDSLAPTSADGEWGDSVLLMAPSKALGQWVKGGEPTVAEVAYAARIKSIDALTMRLLETSKSITKVLGEKANEGGKFTFFL